MRAPFVAQRVLTESLRVPIASKVGGDFYREVLAAACGPSVAGLPSTNDQRPTGPRGPRRQRRPTAVAKLVGEIRSDDALRPLLGDAFRADAPVPHGALQPLGLFAAWRTR